MLDQTDKVSDDQTVTIPNLLIGSRSDSEDMSSKNPSGVSSEESHKKTCADCGTTKTPLWRGGPAGPKSLCNACGIRSRKKRRAILEEQAAVLLMALSYGSVYA
ncbi:hypothetical protein G4B88_007644 [Cannabis sativa]|uniref:GATA-type domain-containing protein n=1 Tax=Cannabis sativa TaxID=3483 RepID=A0A7J6HG82_CANSA|nr:hypothetical protein G4B88_007644 [Cannabis sativa]